MKVYDVGSPLGLAEKLLRYFQSSNTQNKVFIEAGANNGIWQSNTYYLEKILGWSGILVEPGPLCFSTCLEQRKNHKNFFYNAALVDFQFEGKTIKGYFNEQDYEHLLMAQIEDAFVDISNKARWEGKKLIEVPAESLSNLIDKSGITEIELLSLDVEGYELNALKGIDFDRHRPRHICIEIWDEMPTKNEILSLLSSVGYTVIEEIPPHDFFLKDTRGIK
jgi:FkbM family methyltransferase